MTLVPRRVAAPRLPLALLAAGLAGLLALPAAATAAPGTGSTAGTAAPGAASAARTPADPAATASVRARATGRSVPVPGATDAYTALPNGDFRREIRTVAAADGTVTPSAVTTAYDPAFAWVTSKHPTAGHWNSTKGAPGVGTSAPQGVTRAYFQFATGPFTDDLIRGARLDVTAAPGKSGSTDCTVMQNIVATDTAPIDSTVSWRNQPAAGTARATTAIHNGHGDCAENNASFTVTAAVQGDTDGVFTYEISAANETDPAAFLRLSHDAVLTVEFAGVPVTPTDLGFTPAPKNPATSGCDGTAGWIGSTAELAVSARVADTEGSSKGVQAQFHLWDTGGTGTDAPTDLVTYDDTAGHTTFMSGAGSLAIARFYASRLTNGHRYGVSARTSDGTLNSASGPDCYFWYDNTAPTGLAVTSTDYPSNGPNTLHVGQPGVFHLSAAEVVPAGASASGISHFVYSTTSSASETDTIDATVSGDTGTADLTITPTDWGVNYLFVSALDNAGNQTVTFAYRYYVLS